MGGRPPGASGGSAPPEGTLWLAGAPFTVPGDGVGPRWVAGRARTTQVQTGGLEAPVAGRPFPWGPGGGGGVRAS